MAPKTVLTPAPTVCLFSVFFPLLFFPIMAGASFSSDWHPVLVCLAGVQPGWHHNGQAEEADRFQGGTLVCRRSRRQPRSRLRLLHQAGPERPQRAQLRPQDHRLLTVRCAEEECKNFAPRALLVVVALSGPYFGNWVVWRFFAWAIFGGFSVGFMIRCLWVMIYRLLLKYFAWTSFGFRVSYTYGSGSHSSRQLWCSPIRNWSSCVNPRSPQLSRIRPPVLLEVCE